MNLGLAINVTVDQQIQVWNTVGTWLAGIATFAAVVVSLRLAGKAERLRLKVNAGVRLLVRGDGTPAEKQIEISVTNLADRPVTIDSVGWAVGKGKSRQYSLQNVSGPHSSQYPVELAHGKRANFLVSLVDTPEWPKEFANNFVQSGKDRYLDTLVAQVHTSIGKTIEAKAERGLIELIKKSRADG